MIDYNKIATAERFYEYCGYKPIEVPWIVSLDTMFITRPKGARLFSTFAGELVASGEQSFLEMRKKLKPGKYQCTTPCFRDEPIDELHHQYFLKNELIWVIEPGDYSLQQLKIEEMITDAKEFFDSYAKCEVIDCPIDNAFYNKDITINGIEVGSYGYRSIDEDDFSWIYGTGCAEPRLTQSILAGLTHP